MERRNGTLYVCGIVVEKKGVAIQVAYERNEDGYKD